MENKYIKRKYLHSELTSQLIGFAYKIFGELGYGLPERVYQKSFETLLRKNQLNYDREKYGVIKFDNVKVGKYFIDFLIDNKIAIEFKVRNEIYQKDISQLLNYIKSENIKVGLVIAVSKEGIKIKRLVN